MTWTTLASVSVCLAPRPACKIESTFSYWIWLQAQEAPEDNNDSDVNNNDADMMSNITVKSLAGGEYPVDVQDFQFVGETQESIWTSQSHMTSNKS